MKVTINIDDKDFWHLANKAEQKGVKVADLLVALFHTAQHTNPGHIRPLVLTDQIQQLWDRGIPDPVIANRLGQSIEAIRSARRKLKLAPHPFKREDWEHELNGRASVRPSALTGGAR